MKKPHLICNRKTFITTPLIVMLFIVATQICKAQTIDPALAQRLTINGVCLCQTTIQNLKQAYPDLSTATVEEMDLAQGCFGQDSRYIAGNGFATATQPGMIFQKDQDSDYVSKIRLTRQFKGKLPDGTYIDLSVLKLKDIFTLYPGLKDKWGSRGCSNYWNFSNDTISFYVQIDTTKKPQFPIDEAYYMDKPIVGIDIICSCFGVRHTTRQIVGESLKTDPVFFVDSVKVTRDALSDYQPTDIATLTIIKNPVTINKLYPGTKNQLVYIVTKKYAAQKYWTYFKSKSADYGRLVTSPQDSTIQYILNGKVLKANYEGTLIVIDDVTFRGLKIINKKQLADEFGVTDKAYGVEISTVPRQKPGN